MDETLIAGENCLKQFITNNSTCPIQPHDDCQYSVIKPMRRLINDLTVICPRQFQQELQTSGRNEEGQTFGSMAVICDFKGKIKDISDHLNKSCVLKLVDCWFKEFNCSYSCQEQELEKHLNSNMKQHFDLVMTKFASMQRTIQQQQMKKEMIEMIMMMMVMAVMMTA
ncbi:hypothetical protein RFI_38054, partial [Reticulomyxa filosa]